MLEEEAGMSDVEAAPFVPPQGQLARVAPPELEGRLARDLLPPPGGPQLASATFDAQHRAARTEAKRRRAREFSEAASYLEEARSPFRPQLSQRPDVDEAVQESQ